MEILIKQVHEQAKLPAYQHEASVGMDLYTVGEIIVAPKARVVVNTGVAFAIPVGYVGFLVDRQGALIEDGVSVAPGHIDSGYRAEVKVVLVNHTDHEKVFAAGEAVARLMVQAVPRAHLIEAEDLGGA
jgi:dUTP pyrophosphatase